jgi:hypothetical protein
MTIDVRTDYRAGLEFVAVSTELFLPGSTSAARVDTSPALLGDEFVEGRRVAELSNVPAGEWTLVVSLLTVDGVRIAEKEAELTLSRSLAVTVVVGRTCDAGACDCTDESTCTAGADCTTARCEDGACLYDADDTSCEAGLVCDPADGCVLSCRPGDADCCGNGTCDAAEDCLDCALDCGSARRVCDVCHACVVVIGYSGGAHCAMCMPCDACAMGSSCWACGEPKIDGCRYDTSTGTETYECNCRDECP